MSGYVLDTNVISELVREAPDKRVLDWVAGQAAEDLYLSVITIGELRRGIARLPSGRQRAMLTQWLDRDVAAQFDGRILAFDRETAVLWGDIMADGDRRGRLRPALDAQIAATAARHDLAVATRDISDFTGMGVGTLDPWRKI